MNEGYLQRLTASVLKPGGTIRPILKPIYSSAYSAVAEVSQEAKASTPARWPETPAAQTDRTAAPALAMPLDAPAVPAPQISASAPGTENAPIFVPPMTTAQAGLEKTIHTEADTEDRAAFKPLVRKQKEEAKEIDRPTKKSKGQTGGIREAEKITIRDAGPMLHEQPSFDLPRVRAAERAFIEAAREKDTNRTPREAALVKGSVRTQVREVERHTVVFKDRYRPLIEQAPQATPRKTSAEISRRSVPMVGREEGRGSWYERTGPQHEPDEIEIHIGRIEVTAVPPPAARAASRPQSKPVSLAEYLKSRHGRT
jgi:hypothetical protein